jgi:hypothetical protein
MALSAFAPTGGTVSITASATTSNVALSLTGSPPTLYIVNIGEETAFVSIGASNVTASATTSLAVPADGTPVALTVGANTHLAAVTLQKSTRLNITSGT